MRVHRTEVPQSQIEEQFTFIDGVADRIKGQHLKAFTHTFGCQQNEADTEQIRGMLAQMGYDFTENPEEADFILYNTCAIRENAENHAFGNIGELAHIKRKRPDVIIAMCGCMVQQEQIVEKIRRSYPQVGLLFGTHALWRFPSLLFRAMTEEKRVFDISGADNNVIAEGLPILRQNGAKAWLSIMYGCNNFCTFCIVPHVRGRERSRHPDTIERELRALVQSGYKEITLLGQNVNSYGKDLGIGMDFSDLLRRLNNVEGDFLIRFMTSHPKDASTRLFDAMADCEKVAKQLHLPFQSGSSAILKRMNRGYTAEGYRALIAYAQEKMPDITLSSDIIVGFPGESDADFQGTLQLVQDLEFDSLFTFIYSKRSGTPAANFPDDTPHSEKQKRLETLLQTQAHISQKRQDAYLGKTLRVLVDARSKNPKYPFTARTEGNLLLCCRGENLAIGEFHTVTVDEASLRCLYATETQPN